MNNIVCSYGCVATTDSQGVGTIRDLPSDELGKILRLLQKQSEDEKEKTMKCDNCDNPATMSLDENFGHAHTRRAVTKTDNAASDDSRSRSLKSKK